MSDVRMKATEHKETGERMHVYEVGYIVLPSLTEEKVPEEVSAIRGMLESTGAAIIAEEFPKLRTLAYTMERSLESKKQKYNEGYFGWIKFELPAASIANVKNELDKRQNVLRHLIIKTVRENTLYSTRLPRKTEDGVEIAPEEGQTEDGSVKKEIDKSIDALVIS